MYELLGHIVSGLSAIVVASLWVADRVVKRDMDIDAKSTASVDPRAALLASAEKRKILQARRDALTSGAWVGNPGEIFQQLLNVEQQLMTLADKEAELQTEILHAE